MRGPLLSALAFLAIMSWPSPAAADNMDDVYCVGQDYMAYSRSAQRAQGGLLERPPYVYILRLRHGRPTAQSRLQIAPLSVHTISCGPESIVVTGRNGKDETSVEVRWDKQGVLFKARTGSIPRADTSAGLPYSQPSFLGRLSEQVEREAYSHSTRWTETERVPLLTDREGHRYALEIVYNVPKQHHCGSTKVTSRVIELSKTDKPIRSVLVFRGEHELSCGE